MRFRILPLLAVLLAGAGCGQVWKPLDSKFGREVPPPPADDGRGTEGLDSDELTVSYSQTLEERYPFIRFVHQGDGTILGLLVMPQGMGEHVIAVANKFCACLQGEEPSATLEKMPELGSTAASDPGAAPWASAGQAGYKAVEEVLLLRGTEEDIDEVLQLIETFYNQAPQIEIQAVVIEEILTDTFERGVDTINSTTALIRNLSGIGPDGAGPFIRNIGGAFPTPTGQDLFGGSGAGTVFQLGLLQNDIQLNALVQYLESKDNVDIVARPRVVTRNGVSANLSSVERFPVLELTNISTQGVSAQRVKYEDVGVTLKVQPYLVSGDTIILSIWAEVNRIGRLVVLTTDTLGNPVFTPTFNKRNAQTVVQVRNEQTVVIGGLKLKETRSSRSQMPILGSIPLLDLLFSSENEEEIVTDVTFMIKPVIKTRSPSISAFEEAIFDPFAEGN